MMKAESAQTCPNAACEPQGLEHLPLGVTVSAAFAFLAAAVVAVTGCQSSSADYSSVLPRFDAGSPSYTTNHVEEGDVISITFRYSTNFNTIQKVGLDGDVNLEGAGVVKAAGKTSLELQQELTKLYQSQVKDDPLTLKIVSAASAVYVAGAVNHPGKISMERPMTVVEAIMEAGGFDSYRAKLSGVSVLRVENGRQKAYPLNLEKMLSGKDPTPFYLKPFDVVRVPVKTFNF